MIEVLISWALVKGASTHLALKRYQELLKCSKSLLEHFSTWS